MAKDGRKVKISQMLEHRAIQNNGLESHSQGEMRPDQGIFHSSYEWQSRQHLQG